MKRVMALGLLVGVVVGLVFGLTNGVWAGVVGGVGYGLGVAVVLRHVWGSPAMSRLGVKQRKRVRRALRSGMPMDDPKLAPALIDYGKAILAVPIAPKAISAVLGLVLVGMVAAAVFGLVDVDRGVTYGLPFLGIALVAELVFMPFSHRQRDRVARSVRKTEALRGPWCPTWSGRCAR